MEIESGGLRPFFLDDFHRCLEKPPQRTLRLSHSYQQARRLTSIRFGMLWHGTDDTQLYTEKSAYLITDVDCQLPPPGGPGESKTLHSLVPFGGFYNFLRKGRPETHSVRFRAPILYGNPIHRPATATVPASEKAAADLGSSRLESTYALCDAATVRKTPQMATGYLRHGV